jgi:hypothetical protein
MDTALFSVVAPMIALMMEAASTSETSVNFYHATQPNNTEDSHLHSRRRENLKSQKSICTLHMNTPRDERYIFARSPTLASLYPPNQT